MIDYPTALGVHIFAGGFTLGVKQAGFKVLAHLEDGKYGVASVKGNWPDLDIFMGEENWPVEILAKAGIDFLYSNPPCAIFSTVGISITHGRDAWRGDPRLGCWYRAFRAFRAIRPKVFALESVLQAYTKGREIVNNWTKECLAMGYSVYHVLIDGKWTGLPQSRKRFFYVASLPWLPLEFRFDFSRKLTTVGEALNTIGTPGEYKCSKSSKRKNANPGQWIKYCQPGERLNKAFDRIIKHPVLNCYGEVPGRPSFLCRKLETDKPMEAFIGNFYAHPKENRFLGTREMRALCGYPLDYYLEGSSGGHASLLARTVMPPVGEWIAGIVRKVKSIPARTTTKPAVTLVDIRKPPGIYRDLTEEYLPESYSRRHLDLLNFSCEVKSCNKCPRMTGITHVMSQSNGPVNAKILFVGEAPGKDGAGLTGTPFYGDASGTNFETLIKSIGLSYNDVFITNAVLCNPLGKDGKNDAPTAEETTNCLNHLKRIIEIVNPPVIASLGAMALASLKAIEKHELKLAANVAKEVPWYGRVLVPLYHPSPRVIASIRDMATQRGDYRKLKEITDRLVPRSSLEEKSLSKPLLKASKAIGATYEIKVASRAGYVTANLDSKFGPVLSDSEKPLEKEKSGTYIRRLWMTGKYTPEKLVELVHANWEGRTTKVADVYWNYRELLDVGIPNVPSWQRETKLPGRDLSTRKKVDRVATEKIIPTVRQETNSFKPRLLLTGSTPIQIGSEKTRLKIITAVSAWKAVLEEIGYNVDWRAVTPGESLEDYEVVIVILDRPNSIASSYFHGAAWALQLRSDAIIGIDDWQIDKLISGFRVVSRLRERLFRLRGNDLEDEVKDQIYEVVREMAVSNWRWPVIVPTLGSSNPNLLRIPGQVIAIDPSVYSKRYEVVRIAPKEKRWILASLLRKEAPQTIWPLSRYGNLNLARGGIGKAGLDAQPRLPEPELVKKYAEAWGVLSPAHSHAGSGWWRVRYLMSVDAGCVLSADPREAGCLGEPYIEASGLEGIRRVENLSNGMLRRWAYNQQLCLEEITWTKEQVKDTLSDLIKTVKVEKLKLCQK